MRGGRTASAVGLALLLAMHGGTAPVRAQAPASPAAADVDPIRCWWRTSASAVRVGEPFSLVLTCAVVESGAVTVVPDQSKLEPGAVQLQPFEVLGGSHGPDLRSGLRRFFQYQYSLRLISEDLFGKDVRIPSLQVEYVVESRVAGGESVRGMPRTYLLPVEAIRVASLVPQDAADIRDATGVAFTDIDRERFRAHALLIAAGVLGAAGALVALVAALRLVRTRRRARAAHRAPLSNLALARMAGRELRAVRQARRRDGWSAALIGRALAAARVAGSLALDARVSQARVAGGTDAQSGQLRARTGALWLKVVHVSGSATAEAIERALAGPRLGAGRRTVLEACGASIAAFTAAWFGRDDQFDETSLDAALDGAIAALPRLAIGQTWPARRLRALTAGAADSSAWAH